MTVASKAIRSRMLISTAAIALTAVPGVAQAQSLVRSTDLSSAVDSAGNPNQLTVTDTSATQTDIEVEAAVVIAEWTDFNITTGDTVNVTIDGGLGISEATLFNRVIGGNDSIVNGTLNAAGVNFWLVNQNGILFGTDASISAQSFFASTADVANQDIFDFYASPQTDLFGNGASTLGFTGATTNAVQALGNATFVTDGSLMFVGQNLNLTGSFDAGSGRAVFVSATDVDVTFTAGSPLSFTVGAGTTVATQTVGGTVAGASAEFAMFTAAGVVNALLDIDASVNATTALATDRGITLLASAPSTATVEIGGVFSSTGEVALTSNGDLTATANISGSDLDINAGGAISALDLTSTDGNVDLNAGTTITAGVVDTSGNGGAILTATGNITTTSITSNEPGATNGFIDVESTGGGALDLGALSSDGDIALDTTGSLTTASITTLNDLTIGGVATPSMVTFTGNVDADIVDITSTGTVMGLDIEATDGNLDIDAAAIVAGGLTATGGDVLLTATGNITTTSITSNEDLAMMGGSIDVDSTGGGTLDLGVITGDGAANFDTTGTLTLGVVNVGGVLEIGGTNDPTTLNLNGNITAGSFTSASANPFVSQDITTTNGDLNIDAASITTGNLDAENGGGVILTATGNITTTSINSNEPGATNGFIDVESTGGGALDLGALSSDGDIALDTTGSLTTASITTLNDLTIGGVATPSMVTFTGNVDADIVDIDATGAVTTLDVEATDGDLNILAGSILGGHLSAAGGDVILNASGAITTTSITADRVMGNGGAVDVDSTGGGNLNLGDITADSNVTLDTTGILQYNDLDAPGGLIDIGSTATPSAVIVTGDQTALEFIINSLTDVNVSNLTATAGVIDIDAPNISAGHLSATGGDVTLTAPGNITTTSITSIESGGFGGSIDVDSTGGGALDLGDLTADGDVALDTTGALMGGNVTTGGNLLIGNTNQPSSVTFTGDLTAASFAINLMSPFSANNITATAGDVDIDAQSINAAWVMATGGDVLLTATGNITTTSITSNEDLAMMGGAIDVDSTAGGALNLGDLTADNDIALDTSGSVTAAAVTAGGALDIGSTATPSTINLTGNVTAASVDLLATVAVATQDITATAGAIDIDANQQTLGALSATGDIALDGGTFITADSITADSDTSGAGAVLIGTTTAPVTLTVTGATSGASVDATASGTATFADVTSTSGAVSLQATAFDLTANNVAANGGDAMLIAGANVTTATITTTGGSIDVDSTGGGTLDLGDLTSDMGIALDTSGSLTANAVISTGALTVGQAALPTTTTFTGNVTAGSVDIDGAAAGTLTAQDLTANAGGIDIDVGSITATNVSATGNVALDGAGTIALTNATADSDTNGTGDLSIGTNTIPSQLDVTGTASGVNTSLHADTLNVTTATATNGDLVLSGDTLTVGTAQATNDVIADATTSITADTITADSDMSGTGDVEVGLITRPNVLTINTAVTGVNVTLEADTLNVINGLSNDGDITLRGNVIDVTDVTATGGDVTLEATGNVTTTSITATTGGMGGGNIDVDSTAGGALDLGDINADAAITLDTTGTITADLVTAGGALQVGGTALPSTVTFTNDVTAGSIDIDTAANGSVTGTNLTANAGDIDIDTGSLTAATATATGNLFIDGMATINVGTLTADSDGNLMGDLAIGVSTSPDVIVISGPSSGGNVTLRANNALTAQDVTATAGNVSIDSGGNGTTGNVTASGAIEFRTGADLVAQEFDASGGMVTIESTGNATTDDVTASGDIVFRSGGDLVAREFVSTGGNVTIESMSSATTEDVTANGEIEFRATTTLTAEILNANGGDATVEANTVTLQEIAATNNVLVDGLAVIDIGTAIADSDGNLVGDLNIGSIVAPTTIMITGPASGANVDVTSTGSTSATTVTSTNGGLTFRTGTLTAQTFSANGGDATVEATDVTLQEIESTNNVTVDGAGTINLGTVTADSDGNLVGDLNIGSIVAPTTIMITGPASGANVTIRSLGTLTADALTATGGDVDVETTDAATTSDVAASGNVTFASGGTLTTQTIAAGGGDVRLSASDVDTQAVQATGAIIVDAAGNVLMSSAVADSDMDGSGDLAIGTTTVPATITINGVSSGVSTTMVSNGAIAVDTVEATGGDASLSAATIAANTVSATGGDAVLEATGAITTNAITAMAVGMAGGNIDVDSTDGGDLTLGDLTADADVALDTSGNVTANQVAVGGALRVGDAAVPASANFTGNVVSGSIGIASTGALAVQDVTATAGAIEVAVDELGAGAVAATDGIAIDGAGPVNLASIDADSDGNGVGDLTVGANAEPSGLTVAGGVSGANVTLQSSGTIAAGAVSTTGGDTTIAAGEAVTLGSVDTAELSVVAGSILTSGVITTTGSAVLQADDADLQGAIDVAGTSLTIASNSGESIGVGDGDGNFNLSQAELDLISTDTLIIDAGDQGIGIANVVFNPATGANEVIFATSGGSSAIIQITGDISGDGMGRVFRFGGDAAGTAGSLADRITMDIESGTIDLGAADIDLRADDIVFGEQDLINAVDGLSSGDLAVTFVGNSASLLYNPLVSSDAAPLGGARAGDAVFLRAGNISISYANSALFQNTVPPTEGDVEFGGIELGAVGGSGMLNLAPTQDENTFAFFGEINGLTSTAAALAGDTVIIFNDNINLADSRINGCVINSGADCITTIVGTTILSIPREVIDVLTADDTLLVPFDPLVGTNNEGLFSDAATLLEDEDCERDDNGVCVN